MNSEKPYEQFKALENRRKDGPIFIREDGKVGFPTLNSIKFKIGDIVRGPVVYETERYFMLRVEEVLPQEETV
jgi:hypothetical protein